jgi:hypothetical protein
MVQRSEKVGGVLPIANQHAKGVKRPIVYANGRERQNGRVAVFLQQQGKVRWIVGKHQNTIHIFSFRNTAKPYYLDIL